MLISGANLSTSTLLTANRTTLTPLPNDAGSAGRNELDTTDEEVSTALQDSSAMSLWISLVSARDAALSALAVLLDEFVASELVWRIEGAKASTSSSRREWMRRCMLLCFCAPSR